MRRRTFLTSAAALSAAHVFPASAQDAIDTETEQEIAETVLGEVRAWGGRTMSAVGALPAPAPNTSVEATRSLIARGRDYVVPQLTEELRQRLNVRYWRADAAADRLEPAWLGLEKQPDYRHLVAYEAPTNTFALDAEILAFLAARNDFQFRDHRAVRLFGLRGCSIPNGAIQTDWAASHTLDLATPNHINPRCVMGVWRVSDGHIRLFRASTVPQASNMFVSLQQDGWGTSLLPTGLYRYRLGTHNAGTPRPQYGALRNEESYVVLRTSRDLVYDVHSPIDVWTLGGAHNIHAAGMDWANPRYDSSGCQVIHGKYKTDRRFVEGAWADYRISAGLVGDDGLAAPEEQNGQGTFDYMLLTGLEAALAQKGGRDFTDGYHPLRHGSRGPRVAAAQQRLFASFPRILGRPAGSADGAFGATTAFAALCHYKEADGEYLSTVING